MLFAFIAVLSWYKTLVVEVDSNYSLTSQLSQLQFQPYYPLMQDYFRLPLTLSVRHLSEENKVTSKASSYVRIFKRGFFQITPSFVAIEHLP